MPGRFGGFAVPYMRSGIDLLSWAMLWLLLAASIYPCAVAVGIIVGKGNVRTR